MKVFINDFELNSAEARVYLDPDIQGLDMPTIRTSKGQRTGSHGGYIGKQLYDVRTIVLQGRIFSDSVPEALAKRRAIQAALPLFPAEITLRILDDDGRAYVIYCQVIDFQMPIGRFRGKSNFKIDLEATDPIIYDDTAGGVLVATLNKAVPGGLLFSPTSPVFGYSYFFTGGQPNTTIHNNSEIVVSPVIVIPGRTTNPYFINRETGEQFQLSNYAVGEGSATQIDMKNRTVRLGTIGQLDTDPSSPTYGQLPDGVGSNMFGYVPSDADWWGVLPGANQIVFDSAGGSDALQAFLYWRPGYWGI